MKFSPGKNLKYFLIVEPIIKFSRPRYFVNEPLLPGDVSKVLIPVLRLGDTSGVSRVLFHTKDGSAVSGTDYDPVANGNNYTQLSIR